MTQPWIRTHTGKRVNPLDLRPEDISIEDISHALACINRFGGHASRPISVAQHSCHASFLVEQTPHALQALLHDASEAYLGDVTKWLKATPEFALYREAEERAQRLIFRVFGCEEELAPEVAAADKLLVRVEYVEAYGEGAKIDHPEYPYPTLEEIRRVNYSHIWNWRLAEQWFNDRFNRLV